MKLHGKAIKIIDSICFNEQLRELANLLNRKIAGADDISIISPRSEEHTSELQSH